MTDLSRHIPPEALEAQAAEQRQRIHQSVNALRFTLRETVRERLDVKSYARTHIWQLIGTTSALALIAGYGITGVFARH